MVDLKSPVSVEPKVMNVSDQMYLLDGHYLIYRSYHAMSQANLRDSRGQPTGAVYGVLRFLLTLFDEYDPDQLVCAMDSEEPTFRHEFYEEYKIQRPEMPDELRAQIPMIEELFEVLDVPVVKEPGFESDDLLASMIEEWEGEDREFFLVSNDKDNFQLVKDSVKILKQKQGLSETEILDRDAIREELDVRPDQIPDYLSLLGDSVDNIPGVDGIGSTYASRLLNHFSGVEEMFENEEEISEVVSDRLTENILESREQIRDSRKLVVLREDAPVSIEPEQARNHELDPEPLIEFCRDLGFRSILEDLESDLDYTPGWDETKVDNKWVSLEEMAKVDPDRMDGIYLHLEGNSTSVMEVDEFVLVMVFENEVFLAEGDFSGGLNASLQDVLRAVAETDVYSYDQKRIQLLARRTGVPVSDDLKTRDLMLVSYLADPDQDQGLDEIISREAGTSVPDFEEKWPREELANWLARRMVLLGDLQDDLYEELEERSQVPVLEQLELPLTTILACMEHNGIAVDDQMLDDLSDEIAGTLTDLRNQAHELVGREFNLNSPKQLREILFEELDLPVQSKTDSGKPSTNADTLEALRDHHELPEIILEYRKYNKVDSTYLSPLVETTNEKTGKIHTEFHQTVASTGRLSSSNPNLQNIPIREEFGRQVREAFVASREEYLLLAADYSQIELRLLAHMSQDEVLLETFREGNDVHTLAASEIFEKDPGEVDEDDRRVAKVVNYGIAYGLSAHGLSRDLDINRDEAQNYIDRYFERYPGVKSYLDQTIELASEQGYVETLSGRRRYIPELRSSDYYQQQFAERAAVNAPIQGTAADLMKEAMIDLYPNLGDFDCNLLLQVHDELILEVDRSEVDSLREVLEDKMIHALDLDVPVTVEVKTGTNWAEVSK